MELSAQKGCPSSRWEEPSVCALQGDTAPAAAVLCHGSWLASPGNRCGRGSGVGDGVCWLTVCGRTSGTRAAVVVAPPSSLHVKMSSGVALIIIALRSTASHLHDCSADRPAKTSSSRSRSGRSLLEEQSTCAQTNFSHRVTHAMNLCSVADVLITY